MEKQARVGGAGSLSMVVKRGPAPWPHVDNARVILDHGFPSRRQPDHVNEWRLRNLRHLRRGLLPYMRGRIAHSTRPFGALFGRVLRGDGTIDELGLMSLQVVTTTGVGFIVDAFQNLVELENMKFHGFGTGTGAEASSDTALGTEFTTQYASDSTRPTGTTTEASATVYRTVATFAPDTGGTLAVTEHGVFSQAATGGGVLLDRTVFSAVNLVAGSDSLQVTYDLTLTAGG